MYIYDANRGSIHIHIYQNGQIEVFSLFHVVQQTAPQIMEGKITAKTLH